MSKATDVSYKILFATIIDQALQDLLSKSAKIKADAVEFLKSEDCEIYCESIKLDYQIIKRINFENPTLSEFRDIDIPLLQ